MTESLSLSYSFFVIFTGAALASTLALYTRQPFLVAYIVLGAALGPYGFAYINDLQSLSQAAEIGIIFLLFLLGLDLQPNALLATLKKSSITALASSLVFASVGYGIGRAFGISPGESLIIGAATMFSSTIIGIKLLPTTVLHHRHTGELMIGLLIMQDIIAISVLVLLISGTQGQIEWLQLGKTFVTLPCLAFASIFLVTHLLSRLIAKYDHFHEYIFLLSIGWCLGISQLAHALGLSAEIGALIAGVGLATSPISQYIAIHLKPLRDFFLVIFFFSVGAQLNLPLFPQIALPALALAATLLVLKPLTFRFLLGKQSETRDLAWDIGFRLGQMSEFSILIAYMGVQMHWISEQSSLLIQTAAIITFLVSTYIVIFNYPNPLAVKESLRRD